MKNLQQYAAAYGLELDAAMLDAFGAYETLLLEWNQRMNLTAIVSHEDILIKHFLDSIVPMQFLDLPLSAAVLDVGTGAGFPGVPLKILRPDIALTLLDSLQKRVHFLQELSVALGQADNRCLHGRAEELGKNSAYREQFYLVTARAVASLPVLCEYCLPFVAKGGVFLAMKGKEVEHELEQSQRAIALLGAKLEQVHNIALPNDNERNLILVRKISQTPTKYPRNNRKIAKSPLGQ